MGPLASMNATESALTAYRMMMDVVSSNIANLYTTTTPAGGAYRQRDVVLQAGPTFASFLGQAIGGGPQGVQVTQVVQSAAPLTQRYEPGNPAANAQGFVTLPNVSLVQQMTNLITASRAYDANVSAFTLEKSLETRALQLGQNA